MWVWKEKEDKEIKKGNITMSLYRRGGREKIYVNFVVVVVAV